MQWKLPKWQEKQKIIYTQGKMSQQKIDDIIAQAIQDQFYHEALSYIPKLESEDQKQAHLKAIANYAVDHGDIFLNNACSDYGYTISASELSLLMDNAKKLGKSFSKLNAEEDSDS